MNSAVIVSLTGEALLVVNDFLLLAGFVVRAVGAVRADGSLQRHLCSAERRFSLKIGGLAALQRLAAAVVEAFDAAFPRHHVDSVEVALVDVASQEQVQRLRLTDVRRAVGGEVYEPALIYFVRGAKDGLFRVAEALKVLHGAAPAGDASPCFLVVAVVPREDVGEVAVADGGASRESFLGVGVARVGFNAGRRLAADD